MAVETYFDQCVKAESYRMSDPPQDDNTNTAAVALASEASIWSQQCEYQCAICKEHRSNSSSAFRNHLKRSHEMGMTKYLDQHGRDSIKEVWHKCLKCNKSVLHDHTSLKSHLERKTCKQWHHVRLPPQRKAQNHLEQAERRQLDLFGH